MAQLEGELRAEREAREAIELSSAWLMSTQLRNWAERWPTLRRLVQVVGRAAIVKRGHGLKRIAKSSSPQTVMPTATATARLAQDGTFLTARVDLVWRRQQETRLNSPISCGPPREKAGLAAGKDLIPNHATIIYGARPGPLEAGTLPTARCTGLLMQVAAPLATPFDLVVPLEFGPEVTSGDPGVDVTVNGVRPDWIAPDPNGQGIRARFPGVATGRTSPQNVSLDETATPAVSIIILSCFAAEVVLASILAALASNTRHSFEVIVADNGSDPCFQDWLNGLGLPVRLHLWDRNYGFGDGNGRAVQQARGEYLLLVNNDCFVGSDTVQALLDALEASPEAAASAPTFLYPDGEIQEAGGFLIAGGYTLQRGKRQQGFVLEKLEAVAPVDYGSAACLMIRAKDFRDMGGFDPAFAPGYCEDVDLCLRLAAKGRMTLHVRDAFAVHVEGLAFERSLPSADLQRARARCRRLLASRWQPQGGDPGSQGSVE